MSYARSGFMVAGLLLAKTIAAQSEQSVPTSGNSATREVDTVRIRSSVAYARGSGRSAGQNSDQPLNSVDPLKTVLGVAYQPGDAWSVELIGTAVDRHEHVDQTTPQFVPAGYFILDLLAQVQFATHTQVNLGVFNLTDKKYWEWSDIRGQLPTSAMLERYTRPGISFGASVAVQF